MPFGAPVQSKYPPTVPVKRKPSMWSGLFGGGPGEKIYGGSGYSGYTPQRGLGPQQVGERLMPQPMAQAQGQWSDVQGGPAPVATRPYYSGGLPELGPSQRLTTMPTRPMPGMAGAAAGYAPPAVGGGPGAGPGAAAMQRRAPGVATQLLGGQYTPQDGDLPAAQPTTAIPRSMLTPDGSYTMNVADQMRASAGLPPAGAPSALQALSQLTGVPLQQSMDAVAARPNQGVLYDPQNQTGREPTQGVGSFGSLNPYGALANDPNAQMYADPTNVNAQFSTSGFRTADGRLISQDLGALSALEQLRRFGPDTRESLLNAANNRGRQLAGIVSGINDPNYNADGRWFQGAGVGQDAQGRTYFRDQGPVPQGMTPEQREDARVAHLKKLQAQGKGYLDETTGQFIGRAGDATNNPAAALAYQTAAERSKAMAATQAERMKGVQQRAAQMAEERRQRLADRKRGPSVLDMMMQRNPQMAMKVMELQQQGQLAQAQMQNAMQMQQAEAQARMGMLREQIGGQERIAGVNNAGEADRLAKQLRAQRQDMKQRNATALQLKGIDKEIADADRIAKTDATKSEQQLAATLQLLALPDAQARDAGLRAMGQQDPNSPAAAIAAASPAVPADTPAFANGKLNRAQLQEVQDSFARSAEEAYQVAMNKFGLTEAEANELINSPMVGNSWFWNRTRQAPGWWESMVQPDGTAGTSKAWRPPVAYGPR